MSKDIRSFFNVITKKRDGINNSDKSLIEKPKKVKAKIFDSDDEVVAVTPKKSSKNKSIKRKTVVISSDSEGEPDKKKPVTSNKLKSNEEKLKPVNIDDVFGNKIVIQSKVEPPTSKIAQNESDEKQKSKSKKRKKPKTEIGIHVDEDFEKTLLDLDDELLLDNVDILDETVEEALRHEGQVSDNSKIEVKQSSSKENSPNKAEDVKKRSRKVSAEPTPKKRKLEHSDSGIDPDQEAFEKKRYSAMLYQKYKNRAGPKHHGEKELPQGQPNCLANVTFLRTGVLDSLEGDEFENLVKEHGGKVVHGVSKKVNYIVVGEEPGPSKLEKARNYNIPEINEDDLLDMILVKSGMKPKFAKNKSDLSCESGIAMEEDTRMDKKKEKSPSQERKYENKKSGESQKEIPCVKKERHSPKKNIGKEKPNLKNISSSEKEVNIKKKKHLESPKKASLTESKATNDTNKVMKSQDLPQIEHIVRVTSESDMSWTEKYKPKDIKSVIGQQGPASNLNKLKNWLQNWYHNQLPEVRKNMSRPSPWATGGDGAYFKAALLSGPPGVGKTTTASLVSRELGFDVVEFNASDTRSKRLLHEEVSQLLSTTTIAGFAAGKKTTDKQRVLLMDEVDGMAGNEDRGGMLELINLIKNSSIPIICMCNDRNHQKMRSLVNYCFDLRFSKPKVEQIRGAMMSICYKEGLKISPNALTEIINGTGCDVRQTLNHLTMWTANEKDLSLETVQKETKTSHKDTVLGPWEVVRMVFTASVQKTMSLTDKSRLFFYDYSLGPLFVQENYLNVTPNCPRKEALLRATRAADAISMGDVIDSKIRGSNNWSLLESQAIFASVLPGYYMSGEVTKRINFPGWLGKNSSANKHKRMLGELCMHTRISTSGSKLAMKLDYLYPLRNAIINPLRKYGTDGIRQAIEVMKSYNLLREDLTNLLELCQWKDAKNPFNDIDAKVKSAFTRIYNKESPLLPFATAAGVSKKKSAITDSDLMEDDELVESDTEETDDVTNDTMIKINSKGDKAKKTTSKAGTSKAKDSGKGKGKTKKTK